MKKVDIIGIIGVNGTGKSTVSNLAIQHFLDYEHISTDTLLALKSIYTEMPQKSSYSRWELYGKKTEENIVVGFIEHRKLLETEFNMLLERSRRIDLNLLLEGIELDPVVLNKKYANTELFVIGIKDEDLHRERIFDKCKDRPEHLSRFQEYFSCIRTIQSYLIEESNRLGHHYIDNVNDPEDCVKRILELRDG